jgi:RNA polymerase sigma factor (sigma-70 family)
VSAPSDTELMVNVREGDLRQLTHLFERHHVKLYNFYRRITGDRHLSEDLVQELFYRMLKYRHTFRGEENGFIPWMYHLARNVHRDHRRKWKQEVNSAPGEEELPDGNPHAHDKLEEQQHRELLQRALAKLPDDKKEILIMSRYQELRYETIAEILGCSIAAVKVRVHRALKELRTIFFQLSGEKTNE